MRHKKTFAKNNTRSSPANGVSFGDGAHRPVYKRNRDLDEVLPQRGADRIYKDPTYVAHGYTVAAIARIAHASVYGGAPTEDEHSTAVCAIISELRQHHCDPGLAALMATARREVQNLKHRDWSNDGYDYRARAPMKGYVRYWRPGLASPFDERITERIAVHQIAATLTDRQKQILEALVICGNDQKTAAMMLGTKPNAIANHLRRIRGSFLGLWFEHETPPRIDWSHTTFTYSPEALEARRELARRMVRNREEERATTGWSGGTKEFRDTVRSWARLNGHSVNAKGYLSASLVEAYRQATQSELVGSR